MINKEQAEADALSQKALEDSLRQFITNANGMSPEFRLVLRIAGFHDFIASLAGMVDPAKTRGDIS
jgi:hypothetical protein